MPRPVEAEARPGGISRIRLVVEFDGLVQRFGRLVPDAAGLLAWLAGLQRQGTDPHPVLEVVLARFAGGSVDELAADWNALDPGRIADPPELALAVYETASGCRSEDRGTGVMVFAGRPAVVRELLQARIPAWLVSDRPPEDHRQLAIIEAPRVVAEAMRLPVPRAMDDSALTGTLVAVPVDDAAQARERGLQLLQQDARADWLVLGREQIIFSSHHEAAASIEAIAGARCLAERVRRDGLRLAPEADTEASGEVLVGCGGTRLGVLEGTGTLDWSSVRRSHHAIPAAPETNKTLRPSVPGSPADRVGFESLFDTVRPVVPICDEPAPVYAWPHTNERSDAILAVSLPADLPDEEGIDKALASRLGERCGGAAVMVAVGGVEIEAAVERSLWRAERNNLLAAVEVRSGPAPAQAQQPTGTCPPAPILRLAVRPARSVEQLLEQAIDAVCAPAPRC